MTADWQPGIVALVCRWCTYAGADSAGTNRRVYPANVRMLRVPCTGRVNPLQVLRAFELGADGVIVSGCHPGNCHYVQGNLVARRRFAVLRSLLDFVGLEPSRLHFAWVSASEGIKWVELVEQVTAAVREAGPLGAWEKGQGSRSAGRERSAGPQRPAGGPPRTEAEQGRDAVEREMREIAARLLGEGRVSLVLGYGRGSLPEQVVPAMVESEERVSELVWNDRCATNLAVYLPDLCREGRKVAVLVKRCDERSVVGLLQESQLSRQDLVLVGVPCAGVRDGSGLAAKCATCDGKPAELCDVAAGGPTRGASPDEARDPRDEEIAALESLPHGERWAFWQAEFARCLRCYACRAVCPLCYCDTCIADRHRPQWVSRAVDQRGNTSWNLVRALHLAGRCVGCDECARVCPAGIRLDLLNRKLAREVEQRFGYVSGRDPSAAPPLASFHREDAQEFIR